MRRAATSATPLTCRTRRLARFLGWRIIFAPSQLTVRLPDSVRQTSNNFAVASARSSSSAHAGRLGTIPIVFARESYPLVGGSNPHATARRHLRTGARYGQIRL